MIGAGWMGLLVAGACLAQDAIPGLELPAAGTPTFGTTVVIPSGLRGKIYYVGEDTWVLPDFEKLKPAGTIWTTKLNVPLRRWKAGFPGITKRFEWFAIDYTGRFWIEKPGPYKFALLSDDGSKLYIDKVSVIRNDCRHSAMARAASITLAGGLHRIRVSYFQGPRDCLALVLAVAGPGEHWRIFDTDEFKPPANPEEWKYGKPSDLDDGEAEADRDLTGLLREPVKAEPEKRAKARRKEETAEGCLYPPIPQCGP